jgi:hypothetical protein
MGRRVRSFTRTGWPIRSVLPRGCLPPLPYAALVLHTHRDAIHHLAEVSLLRDL